MKLIISLLACWLAILDQYNAEIPPIVKVHTGQVRGYNKTILFENREVFIYEGIPFAEPPVGELRFQKPKPAKNWDGILNATQYRSACMYAPDLYPDDEIPMTHKVSEDCLYLNVFRPSENSDTKRAVMVWIYGGGFESGTAFSIVYDASYLASLGDVVVVTFNYRLGAFGFTYTEDESCPGNQGIYDQLEALKWVNKNIEQFGGDPNMITLFGESAGSISTGIHVLSPLSKGLFQRAIMQSAAPNSYIGSESPEKAWDKTKSMAGKLNCPTDSAKQIIDCMKKLPAKELVEITKANRYSAQTLEPVYNTEFLPKDPVKLLSNGEFNTDLDLIFGLVNNEGSIFTEILFPQYLSPFIENPKFTKAQAKALIEVIFMIFKVPNATNIADYYLKDIDESDIDGLRRSIGDSFGDYNIGCPTVYFGEYFARHNKGQVYSYRLTHKSTFRSFKECIGYMGVCHAEDILYVFGFPIRLRGVAFSEDDYLLSRDIIHSWAHFARHGNPGLFGSLHWEPAVKKGHTNDPIDVLEMATRSTYKMLHGIYVDVCDKFWKPILFPTD